jgi:hypothetical protein
VVAFVLQSVFYVPGPLVAAVWVLSLASLDSSRIEINDRGIELWLVLLTREGKWGDHEEQGLGFLPLPSHLFCTKTHYI